MPFCWEVRGAGADTAWDLKKSPELAYAASFINPGVFHRDELRYKNSFA